MNQADRHRKKRISGLGDVKKAENRISGFFKESRNYNLNANGEVGLR